MALSRFLRGCCTVSSAYSSKCLAPVQASGVLTSRTQALYMEAASRKMAQDTTPALTKLGVGLVSLLTGVEREPEPTKDCAEDCMSCGCQLSVSHHISSTAPQREQARKQQLARGRAASTQSSFGHMFMYRSARNRDGRNMLQLVELKDPASRKTTTWRRFVKPINCKVCLQLPDSVPF